MNFPPGVLAGDERFQNVAFNTSNGEGSVRGPWNEGQGPWPEGMQWEYVEKPTEQWLGTDNRTNKGAHGDGGGRPGVTEGKPFTHEHHIPAT